MNKWPFLEIEFHFRLAFPIANTMSVNDSWLSSHVFLAWSCCFCGYCFMMISLHFHFATPKTNKKMKRKTKKHTVFDYSIALKMHTAFKCSRECACYYFREHLLINIPLALSTHWYPQYFFFFFLVVMRLDLLIFSSHKKNETTMYGLIDWRFSVSGT